MDEGNRSCVLLSHQCHFQDLPGYPHGPPGQGLTKLRAVELAEHQGSGGPVLAEGETFVNECDGVSLFVYTRPRQICFTPVEQTRVRLLRPLQRKTVWPAA